MSQPGIEPMAELHLFEGPFKEPLPTELLGSGSEYFLLLIPCELRSVFIQGEQLGFYFRRSTAELLSCKGPIEEK